MAREKKVIDASAAIKWFESEEGSAEALRLLERHREGELLLVAPELLLLEVTNALRYKAYKPEALGRVVRDLHDLQLHIEHVSEPLLARAVRLALERNLTVYDALYVALAQINDTRLVTADHRLAAKITNAELLGSRT